MTTTYNGYANRATWNVVLWVMNDESVYHWMQETQETLLNGKFGSATAMAFCRMVFPMGITPDNCNLADVNWKEVADAFND